MRDSGFLAWQYLRHHVRTAAVLVAAITLILYLPAALQIIVSNAEQHFRSRAESTPLLVGPRGSPLELVLASVYFDRPHESILRLQQRDRVESQELGQVIPLHTRHRARGCTVVGTTTRYFSHRGLRTIRGEWWSIPGQCVIGAAVASRLDVDVGDKIPVSSGAAFTLGSPPLRLAVAGVLAATESPDDEVIFVNLDTTWIIDGLGHGHTRGAQHGSPEASLYTDITQENVGSFHFHGNRAEFPITALIVLPSDDRARTLLLGQYLSQDETAQIVQPPQVIDALLDRIFMIRSYMIAVIAVVSLATLLTIGLVLALSVRLRRDEIVTVTKIGCSRFAITSMLGSQLAILLAASITLAAALALVTDAFGSELVRYLIF